MRRRNNAASGFTLIEMMIAVVIIMIMFGAIFDQIRDAQLNSNSEQVKMDLFQQGREFIDQMTRDLRQAGYPNPRNAGYQQFNNEPDTSQLAVGLVEIGYDHIWFEGDVDGKGVVSVVKYQLDTSDPKNYRLKRSQAQKVPGDSLLDQNETYLVEIENVQNGGSSADPIFTAYITDPVSGSPVAVDLSSPLKMTDEKIAAINSIKISINLKAGTRVANLGAGTRPVTTLISTVKLNNCSQADLGGTYVMSCASVPTTAN